jgi:tripartite-type tricarboxylate transporter receptor subunit TctC
MHAAARARLRTLFVASLVIAGATCTVPALAQDFPSKPIRVIVPQPPGGGFDLVARVMAERLTNQMGTQFVVENRPGAGTLVGTDAAAKSAPDGYTLLLAGTPNLSFNAGLYQKLPFDPARDFTPVGLVVAFAYTLVARKDLPFATLDELIRHARANPGKLTYASGGNGTGQHIAAAALAHLAKVDMTHVPYKGAQAAYQDLLASRIDLFFDNISTARAQVDAGTVKALAVSSPERSPIHPTIPTVIESTRIPLEVESFFGYFAPAKTPQPVLDRLRAEWSKAVQSPEVRGRFEKGGGRVLNLSASETEALVRKDIDKWTRLIRAADIRAD